MRCMNCGLPLSPTRVLSHCPRCGAALNAAQDMGQQPPNPMGWGSTGATPPPQPWGQELPPNAYQQPFGQQASFPPNQFGAMPGQSHEMSGPTKSGFLPPQSSLAPRRPPIPTGKKPSIGLKIALIGLIMATLLLAFIAILGLAGLGKSSPTTASINTQPTSATTTQPTPTTAPTVSVSPTASAAPSATSTPYPGQQFIDGAQMATGIDKTTRQPIQPTTTFTVGTPMYVTFNLHPPSQGGAVCVLWFLNGKQLITDPLPVPSNSHFGASYAFAIYNNAGPAYVELYWASDKTCSDKVLAQHVDFTVTS